MKQLIIGIALGFMLSIGINYASSDDSTFFAMFQILDRIEHKVDALNAR